MNRFVKIFKGYTNEVENDINEMARKRNLIIVFVSTCINQGSFFATVVFEKGGE
jgi:hypothetical protein